MTNFCISKMLLKCGIVFCATLFLITIEAASKEADLNWWKHAVFYQIYPRSFKDDNNDGIGDLKGIISKLEHLKDAGITATWLSPIYQSPQVDAGYDISDFEKIDENYGTMEDFEELVRKAHEVGIKIIMDFVPNHSSNEHEWFKKSENRETGYEDMYIWKDGKEDGPPNNWLSRFKYSAWEYSEIRKQYYYHQFAIAQPDLNYRNPTLVQNMKNVLKFWMDKGVDGFRMDAVPYLFEDDKFEDEPLSNIPGVPSTEHNYLNHTYTEDQPETFDMIYQWREFIDDYTKENGGDARIMMTEAYTDLEHTMMYYGNYTSEGAHFTFNFEFVTKLNKSSSAKDTVALINSWLTAMPSNYTANWVMGNHDNSRVATKFGPERVDGINMLIALLPGVMVTYNGEEIGQENGEVTWEEGEDPNACNGLEEDFDAISRDFERTPFHWDDSVNAGFNEGGKPWLPVSAKFQETNLAAQKVFGLKSHYYIYKNLLKLRQEPAFIQGSLKLLAISDNVLAFTRELANDTSYVVVINIGNKNETVDLSSFTVLNKNVKVVVANENSVRVNRVLPSNNITLTAYESIVARALPDLGPGDADWWKHAVFYQIYPRSFKDDNNDGIGDLKGIISKLEHLKDAGITATWLSPIYKSPQVDAGYDISDFKEIDEDYGTMEDFEELLKKAHELGIKVIMDFVPNHSSNEHEWFIKSEKREPGYEDLYIWKDGKGPNEYPNNWLSSFKYSAWKYSTIRGQYYLHQFAEAQPDLNYRNPVLVENMKEVLDFWLDKGVDGFRMDAVPHLFEDENFEDEPLSNTPGVAESEHGYLKHIYTTNQNETFDMIYQWREFVDQYTREHGGDARIMMTEAYADIKTTMRYFGDGDREGAHFTFNFQFVTKINKESNARNIVEAVQEWLAYMPLNYTANWVIGNHDNHRAATKYGPERADGMNMLVALLPGVMVTYNGEEIGQEDGEVTWLQGQDPGACNGLEDDFEKSSRDFERTPFHWDTSVNAGFNNGTAPWLPVSSKYTETNLAAQKPQGLKSHYHIYQSLVKLRQEPAFINGSIDILAFTDNVLAFTREIIDGTTYVVVLNIGNKEETVNLSYFKSLKKNVKIVATNEKSNKQNRVLAVDNFQMGAYESIVAKALPDVQEGNPDWWKHAVFYQIYPRSFKDDNNDGIGDLKGIISKLEHLKDAGITATWLSPIYQSPQVDAGYDISDFEKIDENYGTMDDFEELVRKAHEVGIKIIMDFVPNHSSNEHEWFKKSENRETGYEDMYIWKDGKGDGPPNNWLSRFKYSAWEYSEIRKQYYYHQFAIAQPDLNYRNSILVQNMKNVLKFWMDKGVDGFRMDAVPYLFEDDKFEDEPLSNIPGVPSTEHNYLNHTYTEDQPETFDMIYQWREFIDDYTKENGGDARIMMTEAYTDLEHTMMYYGNDTSEGAHFTFNFEFVTKLNKSSSAKDTIALINSWLTAMPSNYTANWVMGNHDNSRVATKFGPERVDGVNMLIALLPGIMVTYNGEEIGQENGEVTWEEGEDPNACNGLEEDFEAISRDFERTPFHWDDSVNAGFNQGGKPWLPVSAKFQETNLAAQKVFGLKSHYSIYKSLLKLRQEPAFIQGSLKLLAISDNVLAFTRELANATSYVVVINIGNKNETVDLSSFTVLKKNVKVVVANANSVKMNRVLPSNNITLTAYESIVARALPDLGPGDADWWKHAVFYQIYPRSFKDDNNDGIGDLKGIISKLEHLKDAGITATWLSPIYKSPQVDAGYDISDFKEIDEDYGTMEDFEELLKKAHELGIKVIMDFVPNHSSNEHEWFIKSEKKEPGYEDLYVWKDGKRPDEYPNNWLSIFKYSAWKYSTIRGQYYLHQFAEAQPDLNYRDPVLVESMKEVLGFWLDKGVDGFRMDAVPYIFEDENFKDEPLSNTPGVPESEHGYLKHIYTSDQNGTFDMIYQWREFVDQYTREHGGDARIMMTEAYTDIKNTMKYFGDGDREGAYFTFNFQFVTKINKDSNARNIVEAVQEWLAYMPLNYTANWVIGNHDNHRAATKYGPERADGMNMLVALLPGVMVTYNGEEIGQEDGEVTWLQGQDPGACNGLEEDFEKSSRDFERTPFHWDASINAGFNNGTAPWLPVSSKYTQTNLAAQKPQGLKSHYHIYQNLVKLRQEPAFINGSIDILAFTDNVLAFTREIIDGTTYVVVLNIGNKEETVNLSYFKSLKKNVKIVATNEKSNKQNRVLAVDNFQMGAYESIVAKALPDVQEGNLDWWKHAVFYQIYPRSFKDDSNDGIGDLKGIISKLDHLKDAGITATWLSPIYKSPQVDAGYDISDFEKIDENYGTMEDFEELVRKAHEVGIKIIMDFVPNHSSNEHEWFIKSENRTAGYEDMYIWKDGKGDGPPNNWLSRFKYSAWEYSEIRKQYYYHQFVTEQPDLNYRNPIVVENMKNVLKFWMDKGVDGFRMDAVPYLVEDDKFENEPLSNISGVPPTEHNYLKHIYTEDQPGTFDMIYQWREFIDDYTKEHGGDARIMMTEAYTDLEHTMMYYGNDTREGAHFTFNFELITKLTPDYKAGDVVNAITEWINHMPSQYTPNWVIGNHDQNRSATRFGPKNVDGFNMLISLLPGVMVTYNGEEIGQENGEVTWEEGQDPSACNGQEEDFNKTTRDFARTPFHWDATTNTGFNTGAKPWLPVSSKYTETNLAGQQNPDVNSHYQIYKNLLKIRSEAVLLEGDLKIKNISDTVLGLSRTVQGSTYVFIFNIGDSSASVNLKDLLPDTETHLKIVLESNASPRTKGQVLAIEGLTLVGHESVIATITDDPNGAVKGKISFFVILVAIFCAILV